MDKQANNRLLARQSNGFDWNAFQILVREKCGISEDELSLLVEYRPLEPVLVRMDRCCFSCQARDAAYIIKALEAGKDWCRDVTLR